MSILELFWMIAFFIMSAMSFWINENWFRKCNEMNHSWYCFCQMIVEEAYKSEVKEEENGN